MPRKITHDAIVCEEPELACGKEHRQEEVAQGLALLVPRAFLCAHHQSQLGRACGAVMAICNVGMLD